jgi:hypothetical protein
MKDHKYGKDADEARFTIAVLMLLFGMPLFYLALILTAAMISHIDMPTSSWQQIDLEGAGTIYIPGDWTFETIPDTAGPDVVIYGPSQEGEERKALFYYYKLDDGRLVQGDAIFDRVNSARITLKNVASCRPGLTTWSMWEHNNSDTGEVEHYFRIALFHVGDYLLISEANAVRPSTALLIALSFESYPNR